MGFWAAARQDRAVRRSMMNERRAYETRKQAELQEIERTLAGLLAKMEASPRVIGRERTDLAEALRARYATMGDRLDRLRGASNEAWEQFRTGVENAWRELVLATNEAAMQLGDSPR